MRLNDNGISEIASLINDKWGYLKIDGTDSVVLNIESSTITAEEIELVFTLSPLQLVSETINTSGLSTTSGAATLDTNESYTSINKDDLTRYRFTYTLKLIR